MKRGIAIFEIVLMIGMTFSLAYIVSQTNDSFFGVYQEDLLITKSRQIILAWLSHGLVSAQPSVWTCKKDVNGSICQEYISDVCEESCSEECFQGAREDYAECKLGTCFDPSKGICQAQTPKFACEDSGGQWFPGEENPAVCSRGCCQVRGQAQFLTETACVSLSSSLGILLDGVDNKFDPLIRDEISCLAQATTFQEGACVLDEVEPGKSDCRFLTKTECQTRQGDFYANTLCSNPGLNTICERQDSTSCIEGKDGVYWVDSCGNPENIYDSNKIRSYNDGKVLPLDQSCELGIGTDSLGRQSACGNCNYLAGSVCGSPGQQDARPDFGDFVCKELSCIDENGNERKQGESWCVYESAIGAEREGNEQLSTDTPGSSHYRASCLDGEVRIDACASGRREICSEVRDEEVDFSTASCRLNQWALCLEANKDPQKLNKCEANADCILKSVDMTHAGDDTFKFDLCVPRYPPGFNLQTEEGQLAAAAQCALATMNCKKISVKRAFRSTKKINVRCDDADFTETMNNLCVSLGDCGAYVNYLGEYTQDGYVIDNAPELGESYISQIEKYKDVIPGKVAGPLNRSQIAAIFGHDVSDPNYDFDTSMLDMIATIGGVGGLALASLGYASFGIKLGGALFGAEAAAAWGPGLGGYGGAFAGADIGALIGVAVVAVLISQTGIGAGLSEEMQLFLLVNGALAGGLIGLGLGAGAGSAFVIGGGLAWIPVIGWVIAAALIATIAIGYALGWGKKSEKVTTFQCLPWQPSRGGDDCGLCGADGLPCSEYKCQSLGQTCEFINEGTTEEACISNSHDDVVPPVISPNEEALLDEYTYSEVSDSGFNFEGPSEDGCLPVQTPVQFGIKASEAAQCKLSYERVDFEEMEQFFGGSNLYRTEHFAQFNLPSLGLLSADEGIDPDARADLNLYVRCSDKNGNYNLREYTISFCVSPENDLTPPIISRLSPESGGFVSLEATEQQVSFYTNEPSECRWSGEDVDFDSMNLDSVECNEFIEEATPFGWLCQTTLPIDSEKETNQFYFRCKDQPWLEDSNPDNKTRNKNAQSIEYTLTRTTDPLRIASITPNDTVFKTANLPIKIDLEVKTSGGVSGAGNPKICRFDFSRSGNFQPFFSTGTDDHSQPLELRFERTYIIPIRCEDSVGNTAESSAVFTAEVDGAGPMITSVYNLAGKLNVRTTESATCQYNYLSCGDFGENATTMSPASSGFLHTSGFKPGLVHYIRCEDTLGNPSACLPVTGGF